MKALVLDVTRAEDHDRLLERFQKLVVWKKGSVRAPHKPLLVLLALARIQQGRERLVPYEEVEPKLWRLLEEFGPPRKSVHPEYPFVRLRGDAVWEVPGIEGYGRRTGSTDVPRGELIAQHACGGFTEEVHSELSRDPRLCVEIAENLLEQNFPESLHGEILDEIGFDARRWKRSTPRDPAFRAAVLQAYARACAVCGCDGHLSSGPFGLDAAHIQWKQAHGPDEVSNGIAMCVLHHRAFDRGAFTIRADLCVSVSANLVGGEGVRRHFFDLHGLPMRRPHASGLEPSAEFLEWHAREVFRAPERGAAG